MKNYLKTWDTGLPFAGRVKLLPATAASPLGQECTDIALSIKSPQWCRDDSHKSSIFYIICMCCVSMLPLRKQHFHVSPSADLLNAALAPTITSKKATKPKNIQLELHISGRKKPTVITQAADDISRYVIVTFFPPHLHFILNIWHCQNSC